MGRGRSAQLGTALAALDPARGAGASGLGLWIFGEATLNATTAALVVIGLVLITRVVTSNAILANKQAWNRLA